MAGGRPTKYTIEIAKQICLAISTSNKGLFYICSHNDEFPDRKTVYAWLSKHPEFRNMYAEAKMQQADYLSEEIIEIADDSTNDTEFKRGEKVENREWVNRSRLRVDTRKWLASKLYPRVYGDKIQSDINAKVEAKVDATISVDESRRALAAKFAKDEDEIANSESNI